MNGNKYFFRKGKDHISSSELVLELRKFV